MLPNIKIKASKMNIIEFACSIDPAWAAPDKSAHLDPHCLPSVL